MLTGGSRPVLLLVEDAHWMDPTTRELLGLCIDRVAASRCLVLVTFRPEFQHDWAGRSEVTALARVVARHGGVYATHLRSEMQAIVEALHEAGDTAFAAGVPLVISHHKCAGPANWDRTLETLPLIDALGARQDIAIDVYPYVAGSTVLREDLVDGVIDVMLTWSEPHPEVTGRMLADVAREWGVDQRAACRRLQPGGACYFQMKEADVERVIAHPRTMIGSDGLPRAVAVKDTADAVLTFDDSQRMP